MDKKRFIYILIFILICVLLGFAIYRVFFYKPASTDIVPGEGTTESGEFPTVGEGREGGQIAVPPGELPSAGDGDSKPSLPTTPTSVGSVPREPLQKEQITQVIKTDLQNPTFNTNDGIKFYDPNEGRFYKVKSDGTPQALSDQVFYNVENVTWSPTENSSIIEYPDGANIFYNFNTKEQVTLPQHWTEFSFSEQGEKIAAKSLGLAPENRWIVTSDPKGRNIELIEPLGQNADRVIIDWSPNQQVVGLSATGDSLGLNRQEILLIGLHGENYKSIVVEGRGLQSQWSPDGGKLLHSVYNSRNDYKPELWIVNAAPDTAGTNRKLLNVNTWADKCTMSDDRFVYCGVPENLERGAGLDPSLSDSTQDELIRIDTLTGLKTKIPLDRFHTIDSMFVSDGGNTLFFTDKHTSGLFRVSIK